MPLPFAKTTSAGHESDDEDVIHHAEHSDTEEEAEAAKAGRHGSRRHLQLHAEEQAHADSPADGNSGQATPELDEGMLPRDKPRKTAFYDPVAERQMTHTDAKLFYQRSQLEGQSAGGAGGASSSSWGPMSSQQNSPILTAGVPPATISQLPSEIGLSSMISSQQSLKPFGTASSGVGAPSESELRRDPSYFNISNFASGGSYAQPSSLGGLPGGPPGAGNIDPALQQQMLFTSAAVPGIGSSQYLDSDPSVTGELATIFKNIHKILDIRHKYIRLSLQGPNDNPKDDPTWNIYPPPPEPAWGEDREKALNGTRAQNSVANSLQNSLVLDGSRPQSSEKRPETPKATPKKRKPGQDIGEDFDLDERLPVPGPSEMTFRLDDNGVYQVYESSQAEEASMPCINVPTIREYYLDLEEVLNISSDGPSKSFAFRRLQYLEGKFNLYTLLNEYQETAESKKVPHRDFYNVRKVDTHVHHSACMNQKHLLRFIKSKMKKAPDEVVLFRDGKHLTLAEVFESIKLTAYDLSIDTLDMHAHTDSFHRFDKFNLKYNPIGESRLRTIFLKTDNFIKGRYLAEITKEVISDLESSKYQMVEWRISIYGKSMDEWDMLAAWVVDNKLFSHNVRWIIQIPRLYDVYKGTGLMDTFEQVVKNIFQPLFEVTKDPSSHPKLHLFLERVIGIDSVDDESKPERRLYKKFPVPKVWDSKQNPPYSYWMYYLFANMTSLNFWRKQRGYNTFILRPHCGEAGDSDHLAVAVLCCHSISHGLLLRKVPLLQYIFYLEQIGIAMSPLSNNALFLAYERNPFHQYFKRGLNVSLSTDDPLQFAFTKEPLIEEYAVAAQIYKLSPVDMCELAKNSVKQSGYEFSIKQQWLGPNFHLPGASGNTMVKTNVPDRREEFRYRTLLEEQQMVERYTTLAVEAEVAAAASANAAPGEPNGSATAAPSQGLTTESPALSLKTSNTAAAAITKQPSHISLASQATRTGRPGSALETTSPYMGPSASMTQSQVFASPLAASARDAQWPAGAGPGALPDPMLDHLSGNQPRYFPGVVTRSNNRRSSSRQQSMHEGDEAASSGGGGRKAVRKELSGLGPNGSKEEAVDAEEDAVVEED